MSEAHLSDVHFRSVSPVPPPPPPPPPPSVDEVYIHFAVAFEQEALDEWGADAFGAEFIEALDIGFNPDDPQDGGAVFTQGVFTTTFPSPSGDGNVNLWTDFGDEDPFGGPLNAGQWYEIDLHIQPSADHEALLDGVTVPLPDSFGNSFQGTSVGWVVLGNLFYGTVAASQVYFDDVRIGTTAYGSSDLFSDDFEGTLSGWDAVKGTATLVADPFDARGDVLQFLTDELPTSWGPFVAWQVT